MTLEPVEKKRGECSCESCARTSGSNFYLFPVKNREYVLCPLCALRKLARKEISMSGLKAVYKISR